ncbi:MAG TPA: hypothetical protein VLU46_07180 [Thermoanaerobaculia bacterium]|nr:hypothetical protein [Thermoanaerobaculia bacterium]
MHFIDVNAMSEGVIAGILRGGQPARPTRPREGEIAPPDEDTWTRTVNFLAGDPDDDLPFMRFRLGLSGWTKEYVADPVQPEDGFTLTRSNESVREALVLQRAFESADAAVRRQLRRNIEAKLGRAC